MLIYLCALCTCLSALIATILWTPLVIRLANRFKVLDHPGLRRIHTAPVPRLGGLAIALPVMVAVVCTLDNAIGHRFQADWVEIVALLGGSAFLFCVGCSTTFLPHSSRLDRRSSRSGCGFEVFFAIWVSGF